MHVFLDLRFLFNPEVILNVLLSKLCKNNFTRAIGQVISNYSI